MKPQIPWLRVLVEGVVIVGSILLAFGLQAWWEGRQEAQQDAQYMDALRAEFEIVLGEVQTDHERRNQRIGAYSWILAAISERREVADDSLAARLGLIFGQARLNVPHVVYDDFVASGGTRRLSAELRQALLEYDEETDRLLGRESTLSTAYFEGVYPYLLDHADWLAISSGVASLVPYRRVHPSGFEDLLGDRRFQNLLVGRLRDLAVAQGATVPLIESVERVLTHLDQERSSPEPEGAQ